MPAHLAELDTRQAEAADRAVFLSDVHAGLSKRQKTLSSKYFYDRRGSELFERICELEAYYPTRCELAIMQAHAGDMAAAIGPAATIVELGAGASVKTRLLLGALDRPAAYIPVDISGEHLADAAASLAADFPRLPVLPVQADFTSHYHLPTQAATQAATQNATQNGTDLFFRAGQENGQENEPVPFFREGAGGGRRVIYFPGSTIGNFRPTEAVALLRRSARIAGDGCALLIGVDLRKDPAVLEAAYNDPQGVTAAFNLNVLRRINHELGGDFDLDRFRHRAFFNDTRSRIEMHLICLDDCAVHIGGRAFRFHAGESIYTEDSHKYTVPVFSGLAADAGFHRRAVWTDPDRLFSVQFYDQVGGDDDRDV